MPTGTQVASNRKPTGSTICNTIQGSFWPTRSLPCWVKQSAAGWQAFAPFSQHCYRPSALTPSLASQASQSLPLHPIPAHASSNPFPDPFSRSCVAPLDLFLCSSPLISLPQFFFPCSSSSLVPPVPLFLVLQCSLQRHCACPPVRRANMHFHVDLGLSPIPARSAAL